MKMLLLNLLLTIVFLAPPLYPQNLLWKVVVTAKVDGEYRIIKGSETVKGCYSFKISITNNLFPDTPENPEKSDILTAQENSITHSKSYFETFTRGSKKIKLDLTKKFNPQFALSCFTLSRGGFQYHYEIENRGKSSRKKIYLPSSFRKYTVGISDSKPYIIISTGSYGFFKEKKEWNYIKRSTGIFHKQKVVLVLEGKKVVTPSN